MALLSNANLARRQVVRELHLPDRLLSMKPIQERAELVLFQALRCVQFRLPKMPGLTPASYLYAMSLRYGLVGAAGSHYVLELADLREEREVRFLLQQYWPRLVESHYQDEIA